PNPVSQSVAVWRSMARIVAGSPRTPARKSSNRVHSPRLVRNSKSRQRLREPLLAGFELLHGRFTLSRLYAAQGSRPRREAPRACPPNKPRLLGRPVRPRAATCRSRRLEEASRPVPVGFEPVDHLRIDDRAGRPRVCEPTWRFAFFRGQTQARIESMPTDIKLKAPWMRIVLAAGLPSAVSLCSSFSAGCLSQPNRTAARESIIAPPIDVDPE